MKKSKIITVIMLIILIAIGYLLFNYLNNKKQLENKMKDASSDYFEKHISIKDSASVYDITLSMLDEYEYDLTGLEKCNRTKSYAKVTVDYKTGKAKKIEVNLEC